MQTRTPTLRQLLPPILFALVCVVLSILTYRSFDGTTPLEPRGYEFSALLPSANGLVTGSDVRMSGVVIGEIRSVRRVGSRARATATLQSEYAPLGSRASVTTRLKSLLGEAYLEVAPGPRDAPALREGATLAASQVTSSQQLADVLSTFDPRTREAARDMFDGLARALRGRGQDLNDAIGEGRVSAESTARLLTELDAQRGQLGRVVASSAQIFDAVGDRQAAVRQAITAGDRVLATTASRNRELRATFEELPGFLRSLRRTADTIDTASGDLNRAALTLQPVAPKVAPLLRDVLIEAPEFRRLFDELGPVLSLGRTTLPAVGKITRAAGPSLDAVYPALREATPFLQLLTANREELVAVLGNVASLLNGRIVGPDNRISNYGSGIATVWNEVVGGWIRKLPTNRANPYLKPQGLRSLEQDGLAETYDCRHLGNPLYLPPTGSGAPICREQGKWTFQGKSAYYPNLTPAAP